MEKLNIRSISLIVLKLQPFEILLKFYAFADAFGPKPGIHSSFDMTCTTLKLGLTFFCRIQKCKSDQVYLEYFSSYMAWKMAKNSKHNKMTPPFESFLRALK